MKHTAKRRVKKALALVTGCVLLTGGTLPATAEEQTGDDWVLGWSDEFDGTAVDPAKWSFDTGNWMYDAKGNPITAGWGNNEKEYYQAENATVADGLLTITARKEAVNDPAQGSFDYTSAKLLTKGKFSTCYGKIEVRARMDTGASLWPAIWMLPEENVYGSWAASGELDIMEGWGSRPSDLCGTIHFGDVWPNNTYRTSNYTLPDSTVSDWHTYAVEWAPDEIRWYADGVCYGTQTEWNSANRPFPAPFDQNFYLILNLAVGGHFDGVGDGTEADASIFANGAEKQMQVDYVRVYHKNGVVTQPQTPTQPAMLLYAMEGGAATVQNFNDRSVAQITATGDVPYSVMLTQEGVTLRQGITYAVSFDASATIARPALVTLEDAAYNRFLEKTLSLSDTPTHYCFTLTPTEAQTLDFKLQLGNLGDGTPAQPHSVTLSGLQITPIAPRGDVNADGVCDGQDAAALRDYLLQAAPLPEGAQCDTDESGVIDGFDLALLKTGLLYGDTGGSVEVTS